MSVLVTAEIADVANQATAARFAAKASSANDNYVRTITLCPSEHVFKDEHGDRCLNVVVNLSPVRGAGTDSYRTVGINLTRAAVVAMVESMIEWLGDDDA